MEAALCDRLYTMPMHPGHVVQSRCSKPRPRALPTLTWFAWTRLPCSRSCNEWPTPARD